MIIDDLINGISKEKIVEYFQIKADKFREDREDYGQFLPDDRRFGELEKLGLIENEHSESIGIFAGRIEGDLLQRTCRKLQYDIVKKIIKEVNYDAALMIFYDAGGHFRFSFIKVHYLGSRRDYTTFKRYSFYIEPEKANKTFRQQIRKTDFSSINNILKAFSIEEVSSDFYNEFKPHFDGLVNSVMGSEEIEQKVREEFALLFVIRLIFIGFVQKKGWLGEKADFVQLFWDEYLEHRNTKSVKDEFYQKWIVLLFFEAFKNPPGHKVQYQHNDFRKETEDLLQMAPFLNGGLFEEKDGIDNRDYYFPDEVIEDFIEFLFQYNFTIEENTRYDEELELNPEFLGIIFEKLINKEMGAIYTPRTEVDLMCRLALCKWLEKHIVLDKSELYNLIFGVEQERESLNLLPAKISLLHSALENVTICDPAAGSGAFEVGMLQVIDELMEYLSSLPDAPEEIRNISSYARKRKIISRSLYGVEVKQWAVWINQLRLWLVLFIEMPDEEKFSSLPLLPSLNFKVCQGDSLVQKIGDKIFPIEKAADISDSLRHRISKLQKMKAEFFENQRHDLGMIEQEEKLIFSGILDEQIEEVKILIRKKKSDLKHYTEGEQYAEQDIFDEGKSIQEKIGLNEHIVKGIEEEIQELENKIKNLKEEKSDILKNEYFIWNIEFAEIFYGKGGFDIIIGNPPYVRQEAISDPQDNMGRSEYKALLKSLMQQDYQGYFKNARNVEIRKINKQSDLYTYFYLHTLKLLKRGGIHCFICSNSWLDVGYGAWVQEFLLNRVKVHYIIDNQAKRSFASADVNTVITVMDNPLELKGALINDAMMRFIIFKKPFEEIISAESMENLSEREDKLFADDLRLVVKKYSELWQEGLLEDEYVGDKWGGKFLRAPKIFFTVLEKGKDKLVRLGDIAEVRRGITTGCNEFFYLTKEKAEKWGIEEEYLTSVIISPRESLSMLIDIGSLDKVSFICDKDRDELAGTNCLNYIVWGESKGYNKITSLKNRHIWWKLSKNNNYKTLWPMIHNDRPGVFVKESDFIVDHNLFEISINTISIYSTLTILFRELFGRCNLGQGALKTEGIDIKKFLIIKPEIIDLDIKHFDDLIKRDIKSIFTECGIYPESEISIEIQEPDPLPDRKELDDIVFDALGLTEEERKDVYRAVCQLVWNRLSKAGSMKKR
ncbi:MAG: Eco57I restriction-modification methylase domain-containing protein [Candidatus Cloacimonetes bacterium]|nr:Eco57I restriction-modification methylase domain-containing protein [Candidatus Cloacimonadota bacterium]